MEETRNKAQIEDGICALTAAAEFLENTSSSTLVRNSSSSFLCNYTSDSEAETPPKVLWGRICKRKRKDYSAEESANTSSGLTSLTSFDKTSKSGSEKTQIEAARLSHLATVACCRPSPQCKFSTLNPASLKTARKLRSARNYSHSFRSRLSSWNWFTMQNQRAISSPLDSNDSFPGDGAVETSCTGFRSLSSSFEKNLQYKFSEHTILRLKWTSSPREEESRCDMKPKKSREDGFGPRLQLRCTAIQKFLLDQTSCSEMRVRQHFGNTPDTSKALRLLLKRHRVKRFGAGGRSDPFVYMAIIPPGFNELEKLNEAKASGQI